jgi:hypothetical protein
LRSRWAVECPDWALYEGHHPGPGSFNRSAAINEAARRAGDFDVAVIADADCLVDTAQLRRAARRARETGRMVLAYERWAGLDQVMTDRVLGGFTGSWEPGVAVPLWGTCSSMVAVTFALWDDVGGFDPRFVGWGMEDVAFSLAASTLGGQERMPGTVWHLWHPSAPRVPAEDAANVELMGRYRDATGDVTAMRALCDETAEVPR